MKTLALLTLAIIFSTQAHAKKVGWRESFGGNGTIIEIRQIANDVANTLIGSRFKNDFGLDVNNLPNVIINANIVCGSELFLDDERKDAINFPNQSPQKIIFDCDRWDKLTYAQKLNLVIHELLPLNKIDDSTYEYSKIIFNFYKKVYSRSFDPNLNLNLSMRLCNLALMDKAITFGANIFELNEHGSVEALDTAIKSNCDGAIEILQKSGVEYFQTNNIPSYVDMIESTFGIGLADDKARALKTLQLLVKLYPEIIKFEVNDTKFVSLSNLDYRCFKGSSILHLLATSRLYTKETFDFNFFNSIAALGFSPDKKNVCGQSAKQLLEINLNKPKW